MDKIVVTITGVLTIIGIYLFFFGKKEKAQEAEGSATITVDGGYTPKLLKIPKNITTTLIFLRTDTNSCLEELIIPDFKIKKYLPMHTPVVISLSPKKSGAFDFHCGMNMFHGSIEVHS